MVADASASDISDKIKEILYTKSAEKIDAARPYVGAELFGDEVPEVSEEEPETEARLSSWERGLSMPLLQICSAQKAA